MKDLTKKKIGNLITKDFKVTKALRQGCSLSPTLLKIYLERVLWDWKKKLPTNGYTNSKHICILTQFCR